MYSACARACVFAYGYGFVSAYAYARRCENSLRYEIIIKVNTDILPDLHDSVNGRQNARAKYIHLIIPYLTICRIKISESKTRFFAEKSAVNRLFTLRICRSLKIS